MLLDQRAGPVPAESSLQSDPRCTIEPCGAKLTQGVKPAGVSCDDRAAARSKVRQHHGGHAHRSQHYLGGPGRAIHDIPCARLIHAAAGQSSCGPGVSAARRGAIHDAVLGLGSCASAAGGLRLRLCQHRCIAASNERRCRRKPSCRRQQCDAGRDELSRASCCRLRPR